MNRGILRSCRKLTRLYGSDKHVSFPTGQAPLYENPDLIQTGGAGDENPRALYKCFG